MQQSHDLETSLEDMTPQNKHVLRKLMYIANLLGYTVETQLYDSFSSVINYDFRTIELANHTKYLSLFAALSHELGHAIAVHTSAKPVFDQGHPTVELCEWEALASDIGLLLLMYLGLSVKEYITIANIGIESLETYTKGLKIPASMLLIQATAYAGQILNQFIETFDRRGVRLNALL